jgi:predicted nucleotide-binding protein
VGVPFHVRLNRKSNPSHDEVKLDLTEAELEEQFLRRYREGRPILVGGVVVPVDDINYLKISQTDEPSDDLLPQIRYEREQSSVIAVGISDEWTLAHSANDVTDDFLKDPPGSSLPPEPAGEAGSGGGPDPRVVFVVHGRNGDARSSLFDFLRAIGLHPLEWSELVRRTGKANPYIGEVLAQLKNAQATVVLLTPDDEAQLREPFRASGDAAHEIELTPQARPNVLFEAGMAMAHDEDRTILVELGTLRPFSDIAGRFTVRLNDSTPRRQELAQRLEAAGCAVNLTGTDWHHAGSFESALELDLD